jgi:hypothetical protein
MLGLLRKLLDNVLRGELAGDTLDAHALALFALVCARYVRAGGRRGGIGGELTHTAGGL